MACRVRLVQIQILFCGSLAVLHCPLSSHGRGSGVGLPHCPTASSTGQGERSQTPPVAWLLIISPGWYMGYSNSQIRHLKSMRKWVNAHSNWALREEKAILTLIQFFASHFSFCGFILLPCFNIL